MAGNDNRFEFIQDRKGMVWDLLLYVPVVAVLIVLGLSLWFTDSQPWSYIAIFLGSLFFFIGTNRILKTRLMLLPSAPIAIEITKQCVRLILRNGEQVGLVKDLRFFSEFSGKTFALTGIDLSGKKQQYIFHRGQFAEETAFNSAKALLKVYR